jgi:hypothetical protein
MRTNEFSFKSIFFFFKTVHLQETNLTSKCLSRYGDYVICVSLRTRKENLTYSLWSAKLVVMLYA